MKKDSVWSVGGVSLPLCAVLSEQRHILKREVVASPRPVNAAAAAWLPVEGALQSYLMHEPSTHKHGDITGRRDALLSSGLLIFNSPLGRWDKFVDPASSPGAALHAAAKQRLFLDRSQRGFTGRRWRRRRGSAAASGRSQSL